MRNGLLKFSRQYFSSKKLLLIFLTIVFFVSSGLLLSKINLISIRVIKIYGELNESEQQQIKNYLEDQIKQRNLLNLNLHEVQNKLQGISWVSTVWANRIWPDTLQIQLSLRHPLAFLNCDKLVAEDGQLFYSSKYRIGSSDLPRFFAPDGYASKLSEVYLQNEAKFEAQGLKIASLVLTSRLSWQIKTDTGVWIMLGTKDLDAKIARFLHQYKRINNIGVTYFDLRYPKAIVLGTQDLHLGIEEYA